MLREIELDHFKCFRALTLPLRPLTLLTGVNASGKSTVIQALILLHQTAIDGRWGGSLIVDGSVVSLGTLGDVLDQIHGRGSFSIGLRGDSFSSRWSFGSEESNKRDIAVPLAGGYFEQAGVRTPLGGAAPGGNLLMPASALRTAGGAELAKAVEGLSYVCAERTGPREVYPLGDPDRHRSVGTQGELAPGLLHWFGEQPVLERLLLDGPPTLARQTEAWLAQFFPGAGYEVQPVRGANLVTLGLRTNVEEDFHRPQHVGFGLSHLFPIIVAVLYSQPGQIVVVENPEVHLHPQGQARVGEFLARAAFAGVQVIVETHSDHVLNGIRRAVREKMVAHGDVVIHFFQPRSIADRTGTAQVITPTIDGDGNIDHWPEGFFDQFEKDLGYLAGL